MFQNAGKLRLVFDMSMAVRRATVDYTWSSMEAEIGGWLGLLLGVAVADIPFALDRLRPLITRNLRNPFGN